MLHARRPWQDELAIIDRLMKSVSDITDPELMVQTYWDGIDEIIPTEEFVALSRRGVEPPEYLITRSSRFTEQINPWKQRDRLPRLRGGLLGEVAYADRPVVIEDVQRRLAPDDPGRFYLEGVNTLVALPQYESGKGLNIGVSLFRQGAQFDHSMIPMMHWQASLFGRGTHSLVLRNQLQEALANLDREMQVVGEIQRSLLPRELPAIPGFDLAACYHTSARAGGDYYDFFPLADGGWGVFIADVSGHGTPAAVLMAITHAIAHTRPGSPHPPADLLAHINEHLARSYTSSGTFVTAFYAVIDPTGTRVRYSSAGHNPPRLLKAGTVQSLEGAGGLPLGIMPGEVYTEGAAELADGDVLVLYTDGITEAMNPADAEGRRELFGTDRLDAVVVRKANCSARQLLDAVSSEVDAFTHGAAAADDQTLIAMRRVPL